MNFRKGEQSAVEQQAGESDEVEAGEGLGQALVVAGEAAVTRRPGEGAFHDLALGQEDEAVLGLGELDDLQADAQGGGLGGRRVAGVALRRQGAPARTIQRKALNTSPRAWLRGGAAGSSRVT
jgi:hypothetical protein